MFNNTNNEVQYSIRVTEHAAVKYDDGSIDRYRVTVWDNRMLAGSKRCVNTGRGFRTINEALIFADGIRMGISSLGHAVELEVFER